MKNPICCVYSIRCKVNGKRYIGSTSNYKCRKSTLLSQLNTGRFGNLALQVDWYKYGADAFYFRILKKCQRLSRKERIRLEYETINQYQKRYLYNQKFSEIKTNKYSVGTLVNRDVYKWIEWECRKNKVSITYFVKNILEDKMRKKK